MSHPTRTAPGRRLTLGLAGAAAVLGLAGSAGAVALAAAGPAVARPASAAAPASVRTSGGGNNWPYFACVAVGDFGVCVGPPTS